MNFVKKTLTVANLVDYYLQLRQLRNQRLMKKLLLLFAMVLTVQFATAQETQVKKGVELLKKGQLEEAIEVFTEVLRGNPRESEALLMRAEAKFESGSYLGARNDCFSYLESEGIDGPVAGLLGKIELELENYKQALSYLDVAIFFEPYNSEYLINRGLTYLDLGIDDKACADFNAALRNGSSEGRKLNAMHCRGISKGDVTMEDRPKKDKPVEDVPVDDIPKDDGDYTDNDTFGDPVDDDNQNETDNTSNDEEYDDGTNDDENFDDEYVDEEEPTDIGKGDDGILEDDTSYEDEYPIDNKVEKIYIDEDLSLLIGGGIGSRRVVEVPEMLILADYSGEIVVDVCVNEIGEVVSSSINESKSTLSTQGLVSLALRKSQEIWFVRSSRPNHCGTITFVIKAS